MNQLSPVSDNIVPYCLCVQQRVQGPGLPPFYQWISRCDRCKITWNVRETWYQNLIHQMNITFFLMMFLYIKWEPSSFLSFGYSQLKSFFKREKKIKLQNDVWVISLLILSIIACLTHPLRPWSSGTPGVPPKAEVSGAGSSYWLTSGCLCCSNPKGTRIAKLFDIFSSVGA